MEIVSRGEIPESKPVTGTCYRCKTVVKFLPSEGTIHDDQRDGRSVSVTCPVCGTNITVGL